MKVLLPLLVSLALFFGAAEARAQISNGVQQNGPVTAADCASWLSSGVIKDSGGSCAPNTFAPITATYTVGSGGNFPTITAALAFTNNLILPVGGTVTLNVLDGGTTEAAAVLVGSVFGGQVNIQSQHSYTTTTTSVQSSSGSAGAYSVILNVGAVTHTATTEDVAITACSGGSNPLLLEGDWAVTNVDGVNTRITITYTGQSATVPSGNVVCTATVLPKIVFTGTDGFDVWGGNATLNITGVSVVGNNTSPTSGISNQDGDRVFVSGILGVRNFYYGISELYVSHLNSSGTVLSDANSADGFNSQFGSVIDVATGIANGNVNNGVTGDKGGVENICDGGTACSLSSNGNNGATAINNSTVMLGSAIAEYNSVDGSQSYQDGYIFDSNATLANNVSTNNANSLSTVNDQPFYVENSSGYNVDQLAVDGNGDGELFLRTHANGAIGFIGNDAGTLLIESESSGAYLYNDTGTEWETSNNFKVQGTANATTGYALNGNLALSPTAPTIANAGGLGTVGAITGSAAAFDVTAGTGAASVFVITLPTAAHGWVCQGEDVTTHSAAVSSVQQTVGTNNATTVTMGAYSDIAALAAVGTADHLRISCIAY